MLQPVCYHFGVMIYMNIDDTSYFKWHIGPLGRVFILYWIIAMLVVNIIAWVQRWNIWFLMEIICLFHFLMFNIIHFLLLFPAYFQAPIANS